jgi:Zn-dependent protease with chaperone function
MSISDNRQSNTAQMHSATCRGGIPWPPVSTNTRIYTQTGGHGVPPLQLPPMDRTLLSFDTMTAAKERFRTQFAAAVIVLLLSALAVAGQQQAAIQNSWSPPTPRKNKTVFAPKPLHSDNIFKGDGEVWLAEAIAKLEGGIFTPIDDGAVSEYVNTVGNNLVRYSVAPQKHYTFIVTTDGTPDAFTIGGGRVYISRALLRLLESEDELAAVLAHEIAHDAFAHAAKSVTRQMFWLTGTRRVNTPIEAEAALEKLLKEYKKKPAAAIGESLLGFNRFDELEADRAAFYNSYKAGYNPIALRTALERLARNERDEIGADEFRRDQFVMLLFGTHPPTTQRALAISWESNFVSMPPGKARYQSAAFAEMKLRITRDSK